MSDERYYTPWLGARYQQTRLLLVSESAYSWTENGQLLNPPPSHPKESVEWTIDNFGDVHYFTQVTRAICCKKDPSQEERAKAWAEYAYWIYIPGSVGEGAGGHRTKEMWSAGKTQFRSLVEELKPEKIIITGISTWENMPECAVYLTETLQAYRLRSIARLAWCFAIPHPANRRKGFQWTDIADRIALFRATTFPQTWEHNKK